MDDLLEAPWQAKVALLTLAVALLVSAATDLRSRKILNAVTYPALLIVAACFLWLGGPSLLVECAVGAAICTAPLLLAFWRGAMGAGDVKLMAVAGMVAGAAAGWPFAVTVLLYVSVAGGVEAVLWLVAGKVRGVGRPKHVPYGVAIAAGTIAAMLFGGPAL